MAIVQCSCLGNFGRFGNQLLQYAFVKSYALQHNAELQIPQSWIGRKLFPEIKDGIIEEQLPKTSLDDIPWGKTEIDLFGYFQKKQFFDIISIANMKKWFNFSDEIKSNFKRREGYYIAAHIRRGDYKKLNRLYCLITENSYIKACKKFGLDDSKLVWVKEENPIRMSYFDSIGCEFLPDFFTIMKADVILRANSTFSLMAAVLSDSNKIYSPVSAHLKGTMNVDFVEGNYPKILRTYDNFVFKE